ncbi:MAG: hypothetical protein K0U98_00920 [Deltaproteobacteria bacterium]|nr:hypothetical protein [Deltaproteobacteria bacterium]
MASPHSDASSPSPSLALWLAPEEPLASELRWWIDQLSQRLSGPRFEPHVTVLSSLPGDLSEALTLTEQLAQRLSPVPIETEGVALLRHYYRAVVLPIFMTPPLWRAHLAARWTFENGAAPEGRPTYEEEDASEDKVSFFPHLSLYYGKAPLSTRIEAIDSFGEVPDFTFLASAIQLISVGPDPENWEIVTSFPLKGLPERPFGTSIDPKTS